MKFNKLSSGNWNARVYDYTDDDGKKHTKSFTAPTKAEIKQMVAEWKVNRTNRNGPSMTVLEACNRRLELVRNSLKVTTIREYKSSIKRVIENNKIGKKDIFELTSADVQLWISELSEGRNPKTVINYFNILMPAVALFNPDIKINVKLPKKKKYKGYCPSSDEIKRLLEYLDEHNMEYFKTAVLLSACGTFRRAELCALTADDIVGDSIVINKSIVKNEFNEWVIDTPKTEDSYRTVQLPHRLIEELKKKKGRLVDVVPDTISDDFKDILRDAGLPPFRFHDLRHYSASIMAYLLISDTTSQNRGGWSSTGVMKSTYQNRISKEQMREEKKINKYLDKHLLA